MKAIFVKYKPNHNQMTTNQITLTPENTSNLYIQQQKNSKWYTENNKKFEPRGNYALLPICSRFKGLFFTSFKSKYN